MFFVIFICAILIFLLSVICIALTKKDLKKFRLYFSWPIKIIIEFERKVAPANRSEKTRERKEFNAH